MFNEIMGSPKIDFHANYRLQKTKQEEQENANERRGCYGAKRKSSTFPFSISRPFRDNLNINAEAFWAGRDAPSVMV
jgi:hypothetical protein